MQTGRPAVPTERKRALGTLRNDRMPQGESYELSQSANAPEPPEGLEGKGLEFWCLVFEQARWISHSTDTKLVEIASEEIQEREQLRALVLQDPLNSKLRASLRALDKSLITNLALMGFTPADRSRLGFAEVKTEGKLQELLRRKEEKEQRQRANKVV
jgi:hypothetical protein